MSIVITGSCNILLFYYLSRVFSLSFSFPIFFFFFSCLNICFSLCLSHSICLSLFSCFVFFIFSFSLSFFVLSIPLFYFLFSVKSGRFCGGGKNLAFLIQYLMDKNAPNADGTTMFLARLVQPVTSTVNTAIDNCINWWVPCRFFDYMVDR